ncbi:MAG: efflux RND transporter periplasmic adaptor subunit, partial [Sulfurimonas sp.]|nr:efflux RND transporter periplasmic adaptor subunit [Sulfurimonas sp.]
MRLLINLLLAGATAFASQNIEISPKQQSDLGIKVQEITVVDKVEYGPFNALAVLDRKDILSLGANVDAVVKEIHVGKFASVKKGEKLITLKSNALLEIQREYIDALIQNQNSVKDDERNTKLEKEGIISKKIFLVSQQLRRSSDLRVELSASQLLANGFTKSMLQKLSQTHKPIEEVTLYSTMNATVSEINVNSGEYVQADKNLMLLYGDGARYLELDVPVDVAQNLVLGDTVVFASKEATIVAISNIADPKNQSVKVRARIEDKNGVFINKVYSADIFKNVPAAFKVKKSSLVLSENKPY